MNIMSLFGCKVPKPDFGEERFSELARYNAEVARGIKHTPQWDTRMAHLQDEYNAKLDAYYANTK